MSSVETVAALFVATGGAYFDLDGVDPWDDARDARTYPGPHPVIAHPPCQLWGSLAFVNFARWGGEHNRPGNDGGCFASALDSVRQWGGVLEHPAFTRAWAKYNLLRPYGTGWCYCPDTNSTVGRSGYHVCGVWQSAYGHKARKRTWLLYAGSVPPHDLCWERPVGTHQIGYHDQRGKLRNKPTVTKKEASATPIAFRDELLALARRSKQG